VERGTIALAAYQRQDTDVADQLLPMPEDWQRALAIVAHPDDLEWGTAGAVAHWTSAGKQVAYLLVTRGEAGIDGIPPERAGPLREAEQRAAAAAVGVHTVQFLEHHDGVIEYGTALRRDLALAIRRYQPELLITINHRDQWAPGSWNTPDHRAVGRAVLDAAADAGNKWIFPPGQDEPPVWDGVRWVAVSASPEPSHAVDISAQQERAITSLAAHHSYLRGLSENEHPQLQARRLVEQMAAEDADRFGGRPCRSFELISR
jgi:LmbE family N-acetylglucosaminyl deacetylase